MNAVLDAQDRKREATSIKISPDVWKKAKIEAIKHDITLSYLLEEAIEEWIEKRSGNEVEAIDKEVLKTASKYVKR
jgi:predicted transcriptional regulator